MTNGTYVYDANGNMASSVQVNRIYTYTSFNLPSRIFNSNSTSDFIYDADHNRISESYVNGTIIFVALGHPINPGNVTFFERHKNFNQAGYEIYRFFVHTPSGATIFFSRQSNNGAQAVRFQLKDNLGSTVADVDATGNVVTRYSFDAFGKVRNPNGSATGGTLSQSRRGFTGHEHISVGNSGLIHMALGQPLNGRVYDATLGRFITADPYIQFPDASQSYNRYSYLFNSPLSGTDPTGYRMNTRQIVSVVVAVVVTYLTYGATSSYLAGLTYTGSGYTTVALSSTAVAGLSGAASGAAGAFAGSLVSSRGDVRESLKAAAYGAVGGAIGGAGFNVVGTYASWAANPVGNTLGHALIGCAQASAQGGNCGNGAISAAVGAVASGVGHGLDFDQYQNGVLTVIAGGASASLTGGSFGDGATIALFGYLFNELSHATFNRKSGALYVRDGDTGNEARGQFFSGTGPSDQIPAGDYAILQRGGKDGFRLEPYDSVFGNDNHDATGQSLLRLHGPGRSNGCVTACDASGWAQVKAPITNTSTTQVEVTRYISITIRGGYLLGRIPVGTEKINYYGRLRVE